MLMLQLLLFLSFVMVVEEILLVPGRGPPRRGGLPVSLSQKPEGLGLGLAATFVLGDAASLGILQVQAKGRQAGDPPSRLPVSRSQNPKQRFTLGTRP